MKATKLKIVEETVAYYSQDVKRRSVFCDSLGNSTSCNYNSQYEGCAVGRLIPKLERVKLDERFNNVTIKNIQKDSKFLPSDFPIFSKLLEDLGVDFLQDLQILHDSSSNWSEQGLTLIGEQVIKQLNKEIENGII